MRLGTLLVKDLVPDAQSSNPHELIVLGNSLFFFTFPGAGKIELWQSDGTETGTIRIKDLVRSDDPAIPVASASSLTKAGSRLFFVINPGGGRPNELWVSDGTEEGTQKVKGFDPSGANPHFPYFTAVGSTVYFVATDEAGAELWVVKFDGLTEFYLPLVRR